MKRFKHGSFFKIIVPFSIYIFVGGHHLMQNEQLPSISCVSEGFTAFMALY
jgi:hypothetical protein